MKIFIVEDDLRLLRRLERDLVEIGYQVEVAWDGKEALQTLKMRPFDLVILDGMLPGLNGWDLVQRFRELSGAPVIMVTARDSVSDRVSGLRAGADDYLIKPFHFDELVARIEALLRRHSGGLQRSMENGGLHLDPDSQRVTLHAEPIELTAREFLILRKLLSRKGTILSGEFLATYLSTTGEDVAINTIEVHVSRLRKKLGKGVIRTVRGLGYTIDPLP